MRTAALTTRTSFCLTDEEIPESQRRMPSRVHLEPCPSCGSAAETINGWEQFCERCNAVGFINLPTDRDALDALYFQTGRGSLERIGVMAQRQRVGLPVRPMERSTD